MVHVGAQVNHMVGDRGTETEVTHAVVARGVLAASVTYSDDGGTPIKGDYPDLQPR